MAKWQDQQRHNDRYEVWEREHEDLLGAAAQLFGRPHRWQRRELALVAGQ